jgi:hypothetical protein
MVSGFSVRFENIISPYSLNSFTHLLGSLGIDVMESWIWWFECADAHSNHHIQTFPREIPMSHLLHFECGFFVW